MFRMVGGMRSVASHYLSDDTEVVPPSKFLRIFQQLDHAFEKTRCAAAVDTAVIEAERNLGFSLRNEFLLRFVPGRDFFPGAETEEQCLIGQGNRRAPFDTKRSEIRNCGDAAGLHVRRNTPLSRKIDKFLIFRR